MLNVWEMEVSDIKCLKRDLRVNVMDKIRNRDMNKDAESMKVYSNEWNRIFERKVHKRIHKEQMDESEGLCRRVCR